MQILHAIQAEVLVALYLYGRERRLEARNHNNVAVALAVNCGLHRLYPNFGYGDQSPRSPVSPSIVSHSLPPPQSWVEFGERLNVFWSVFNTDRCWMVLGTPCYLVDDPLRGGDEIDSPWPLEMSDYERVSPECIRRFRRMLIDVKADLNAEPLYFTRVGKTVQRFLRGEEPQPGELGTSSAALRAKSSAVFGWAQKLRAWYRG